MDSITMINKKSEHAAKAFAICAMPYSNPLETFIFEGIIEVFYTNG